MDYCVYIMTNANHRVLYIGVTNNLPQRVFEHRNHLDKHSLTDQYNVEKLVYYESTPDVHAAIAREKQLKGWGRKKKEWLIMQMNPDWIDLYDAILD